MSATDDRTRVTCPGCGAVRPVSPRMAGLAVVCRGCGRPVRVPLPADRPAVADGYLPLRPGAVRSN